jgi:hypothetical protein
MHLTHSLHPLTLLTYNTLSLSATHTSKKTLRFIGTYLIGRWKAEPLEIVRQLFCIHLFKLIVRAENTRAARKDDLALIVHALDQELVRVTTSIQIEEKVGGERRHHGSAPLALGDQCRVEIRSQYIRVLVEALEKI